MIYHNGVKYACLSCIRGHRSSSCDHKDRPLVQVRRRGRPMPEDPGRIALIPTGGDYPCVCGANCGGNCACKSENCPSVGPHNKTIVNDLKDLSMYGQNAVSHDVKLKAMPKPKPKSKPTKIQKQTATAGSCCSKKESSPCSDTSEKSESSSQSDSDNEVYYSGIYAFIPVGDGLYRKEPRQQHPRPVHGAHIQQEEVGLTHAIPSLNNDTRAPFSSWAGYTNHQQVETTHAEIDSYLLHGTAMAPAIIAPMDSDGKSMLQLGFTEDEVQKLWPESKDGVEFLPSCVIPDQCHCGEGCACPDCYTHSVSKRSSL